MRNIARLAVLAVLGLSGAACSGPDEHRPLGENDAVRIDVFGFDTPFVRASILASKGARSSLASTTRYGSR
ncbi:hypothetical protein [Sorangium sp. So ce887]|uniref:hypothetical protein n=1 Tax=Sorangium sp. So ce887 TaxID=3133324 RepID=UPI003F5E0B95